MSATDQATADDAIVRGEATEEERAETAAARGALELAERGDATLPARHRWDRSQLAVIRNTVAKDCNDHELAMFLEVAARYQLDPFLREIFAAKFNGDNGPVTIFAGRDGMLKAAKLTGKFQHMESAVVREKDAYEVVVDTEELHVDPESGMVLNRLRKLRHVRKGMGAEQRGAIVGAYALVFIHGDDQPWFAEATWDDYGRAKSGHNKSNWKVDGTGYPEAMMVKVPQSIALRMACGLAGIYAQEEVQRQLDEQSGRTQNLTAVSEDGGVPGVDWPEGELGLTLQALFARVNELIPGSWRPPKIAVNVNGKPEDALVKLASDLRRVIASRAPDDPLAVEPEPVTDAEVVDEPAAEEPDSIVQGPVADAIVARMGEDEACREQVQGRVAELREGIAELADGAADAFGFESLDDLAAECERLEEALLEATNGGPTVAEELDAEPVDAEVVDEPGGAPEPEEPAGEPEATTDVEFDAQEYQELEHAIADLEAALDDTEEGSEEHRVMFSNLTDARERYTALRKAKQAIDRAERHRGEQPEA